MVKSQHFLLKKVIKPEKSQQIVTKSQQKASTLRKISQRAEIFGMSSDLQWPPPKLGRLGKILKIWGFLIQNTFRSR